MVAMAYTDGLLIGTFRHRKFSFRTFVYYCEQIHKSIVQRHLQKTANLITQVTRTQILPVRFPACLALPKRF